jgi:putative oxidoreductase
MTSIAAERREPQGIFGAYASLVRLFEKIPNSLIALLARGIVGWVFWQSGQTKIDGFSIKPATYYLFENEYKVPLIPPDIAAVLTTVGEVVLPIFLFVGLATRLSATAMLIMTLVIQLFVFPDAYITQGLWAIGLLFLMAKGPGVLSLDYLVRRRFMGDV